VQKDSTDWQFFQVKQGILSAGSCHGVTLLQNKV